VSGGTVTVRVLPERALILGIAGPQPDMAHTTPYETGAGARPPADEAESLVE
jgi:hypothetical protein